MNLRKDALQRSAPIDWPRLDDDPLEVVSELLEFAYEDLRQPGKVPFPINVETLIRALGYRFPLQREDGRTFITGIRSILEELSASATLLLPRHTAFSEDLLQRCEGVVERPLTKAILTAAADMSLVKARKQIVGVVASTSWRTASDVDIDELAALEQTLGRSGQLPAVKKGNPSAFLQLLRVLEIINDAGITRDLRHRYMMWQDSALFLTMEFSHYRNDPANFVGVRVHGLKRERVEAIHHIIKRRTKQRQAAEEKRDAQGASPWLRRLHKIATTDGATAPEDYFEALGGKSHEFRKEGWLDIPTPYPGREHIDITEFGKQWLVLMRLWLQYRSNQFETASETILVLHILSDYLLLYLPWWCERHPHSRVRHPASPRSFVRYLFISRTVFHENVQSDVIELPKTFLELLEKRRPTKDGRNRVVTLCHLFFQFVITAFEDDKQFDVKGMTNPFQLSFDRVKSSRPTKTNKIPFAENIYPYLVLYSQALETFGEYLQQRAYEDDVFVEFPYGERYGYDTSAWGYVPFVRYRGRVSPVSWIPNIYTIALRTIYVNPPNSAGIYVNGWRINTGSNRLVTLYMPHVSVLRMLLGVLETGQRGQSVQWLDRRTWDSLVQDAASLAELHTSLPAHMFYDLLVNTDKVKENEWKTYISWRVRRAFLAEQHFQLSIFQDNTNAEIHYENRPHSRFSPVVPLFRSSHASTPVSDTAYSGRWTDFLNGFEQFYNYKVCSSTDGTEPLRLTLVTPVLDDEQEPEVRTHHYQDGDAPYCPLKVSAIHTPHACRSTFATHKDGDLEVSEIAAVLGHENEVTTTTYQVPSAARVIAKLEASERRIMGGLYDAEGKGAGYIQADAPSSAVRQAFNGDRDTAIADFGFVPGVALWSMHEFDAKNTDAIELLRQSPSSVIRWHPTHVCPLGNQCPSDIVVIIGGYQRCGLCPFAAKCVDHLPAMAGKKNELKERIRMSAQRIRVMEERGASQEMLACLHKGMENDAKELTGWELSADILHRKLEEMGDDGTYHVDKPEMVRRHLKLVTRSQSESEFFLQRISDSNAYPTLETPEVRARAVKFMKVILARSNQNDDAVFMEPEPYSELAAFASLVKPMAEAKGLDIKDLAKVLSGEARGKIDITAQRKLLGKD